jgi:hypothetical protein
MEQHHWPTPSYMLRLFRTYLALALLSGSVVMIVALSVARPQAMVGVFVGILIGRFLSFLFSRFDFGWVSDVLHSLRRISDFLRSRHG